MTIVTLSYQDKKFYFDEAIPGRVIATLRKGRFYELGMLEFINSLNPKNLVIDVGANIGNHSIFLAKFTDCSEVHSFEPVLQIFSVLNKNIKSNRLQNKIKAHNVAVGDKKGKCSVDYQSKMRGVLPE